MKVLLIKKSVYLHSPEDVNIHEQLFKILLKLSHFFVMIHGRYAFYQTNLYDIP